jgi:hypothetical protein
MTCVARGPSGRVVIELEPEIKQDMHAALAQDHMTLKEWFLARVESYLAERVQPNLPGVVASSAPVKSSKSAQES